MKTKKIAFITDSTAGLSVEDMKKYDIHVVPLSINFGEESFLETHMSMDFFIEKLKHSPIPPQSSQPALGVYLSLYEKLRKTYDMAIAIHLSGKLSGTVHTAKMAAEETDFPVHVIDSQLTSFPMAQVVKNAAIRYQNGSTYEDILMCIEQEKLQGGAYVLVDKLEQLHRGGRVSGTQYFVGNLLQVKPILSLQNGSVESLEKVRGTTKATRRIFELFDQVVAAHPDIQPVILYFGSLSITDAWVEHLSSRYPQLIFSPYPLSTVIGVHSGDGAIGIAWTYGSL